MKKYYEVDDSKFPIVVTTLTDIQLTNELFGEYLEYMDSWLNGGKPFVDIHVLSEGKYMSSEYRIELNNFLKKRSEIVKKMKTGLIMVNSSMVMSMMLKGVFLFNPPPCPHTVVKTLAEAYTLADRVLKTGKF
ncbi:hypothetical protein SanaruYs_04780 [Chryseotalea sanaruensis]|uniref:STAS/SEC14 domain-containing protein n=1 Tax=Chryseotalea sanaruensis TaxID=2482724 RepID=A0A401U5Q9_9BACT|nr:hypothetical protein [Chryseotalea sanaruensis]GCC50263.1 hypothetical protein SanaruYs_04780 [Chryseotalea sanaruensis]